MPNPTVTVEIKSIGGKETVDELGRVTKAAQAASRGKGALGAQVRRTGADFRQNAPHISRFSQVMRNLETSTVLAIGPLSGLGARVRSLGVLARSSALVLAGFVAAVALLSAGLIVLVAGTIKAVRALEAIEGRLVAVTGAVILARNEIQKITDISNRFGLEVKTTLSSFSQLAAAARGTSLEGKGIRDIFEGIAAAASALRLPTQQVEGAIRAVEQSLTKGVVNAEEFRRQLGDQLPGAAQVAAEALGKTKPEFEALLTSGKLLAEEFWPKFSARLKEIFGQEALNTVDTLQGATNRLSNAFFAFFIQLDENFHIVEAFVRLLNILSDVMERLTDIMSTPSSEAGSFIRSFERSKKLFDFSGILKEQKTELLAEGKSLMDALNKQIEEDLQRRGQLQSRFKEITGIDMGELFGRGELLPSESLVKVRDELAKTVASIAELQERAKAPISTPAIDAKALERLRDKFFEFRAGAVTSIRDFGDELENEFGRIQNRALNLDVNKFFRKLDPTVVKAFADEMKMSVLELHNLVLEMGTAEMATKALLDVYEDTLTPLEAYNREVARLSSLYELAARAGLDLAKANEIIGKGMEKAREELNKTDFGIQAIKDGFAALGDGIVDMVKKGTSALEVLSNVAITILEAILQKAIELMILGPILNAIFGAGTAPTMAGKTLFGFLGFQHGGSFEVGGSGGTDSQLVQFKASPRERVTVETPEQQREAEKSSQTVNMTQVNNFGPGSSPRQAFRSATPMMAADFARMLSNARAKS